MRPELFAAYLHSASQWDGSYEACARYRFPIYICMAQNDEYYGAQTDQSASNGELTIAAVSGDKFFLWDGVDTMNPLCNAVTVDEESEQCKVLVVYYSETNNTARVANFIAEAASADIFEVIPTEVYISADLNWNDSDSRVVYEYENPEARNIELVSTEVTDWDSYDTVFIGYPIWWGIAAWSINGFVEANDFTGKTVIPFATSSSSGLGESTVILEELAGSGTWLEGMKFFSYASESSVKAWVKELNIG